MPHIEGKKDQANADNRKAKVNRNITYDMPELPRDQEAEDKDFARKDLERRLAGVPTRGPKWRNRGGVRHYNGPYDAQIALEVLHFRRQGLSTGHISRRMGMPSEDTISLWRLDNTEFDELYVSKYNEWLEDQIEISISLADKAWKGKRPMHPSFHMGLYNAVKARQWLAGRRMAERYGDKVDPNQDQVILQPQELDVITGDQGPEAKAAADAYRLRQAEVQGRAEIATPVEGTDKPAESGT